VLPAVLVLFGRWVFWPVVPRVGQAALVDQKSFWRRVGDVVAARPQRFVVGTLILLALMAGGLTQVRSGLSQTDQFLSKPEAIVASERLAQSFPAGNSDPVVIITEGDPAAVVAAAKSVPSVASATPGQRTDRLAQVAVVLSPQPGTDAARTAVRDLRAAVHGIPGTIVGGTEAKGVDAADAASRDRGVIFPLILALVLVALLVLLRSVVAPLILVGTVVLTFLAAVGSSWWIFTKVFGFTALDVGAPLYTFLFLVALGVDYNIFLVTRAREEAAVHGSRAGMLRALSATGGVITSAGILLAAVFAVLGVLPLVVLAQIGVIICVGVLLDTLVVRTVLVPAIALILGDRFWWPRQVAPVERA
jgi:RND superfamily putative drug exporter